MNVASARMIVVQRNNQIDLGIDPDMHTKVNYRKKHTETFGEIIDEYFDQHVSSKGPSHRKEFARLIAPWKREIPVNPLRGNKCKALHTIGMDLRYTPIKDISPRDVGPYIEQFSSDSVSNSALRQLRALFNWAVRMQYIDRNPCSPFQKKKIIKKRRDYTAAQIELITQHIFSPPTEDVEQLLLKTGREKQLAALKQGQITQINDQMAELCAFMGILLLTMARPAELTRAKFEHFELTDKPVWHKHNTKGIKLSREQYEYEFRTIPIHERVADLVSQQRERWPDSDLVFPNHSNQSLPRNNFSRALKRFKQLEGVPDHFQLYDLKRVAISLMLVGQGIRREDLAQYADHVDVASTLKYNLHFVDPLRIVPAQLGKALNLETS